MNQRKEIIVFTDSMGDCGINRVLSVLTNLWVKNGHSVSVAYPCKSNTRKEDFPWNPEIEMIGIPVGTSTAKIYSDLTRAYIRLLKSRPNATAVSLSVMTNFVMGACAPFVRNRIVISDRNDPNRRPSGSITENVSAKPER